MEENTNTLPSKLQRKGAFKRKPISNKKSSSVSNRNNSGVDNSSISNNSGIDSSSNSNTNTRPYTPDIPLLSNHSQNNNINDEKLYFVLIRAHGGLPYIQHPNIYKRVETITVPSHMNIYKITSSVNGAKNCGDYNYDDKKSDIKKTIDKHIKTTQDPQTIAEQIQRKLRQKEQKINTFKNSVNKRSSISTEFFINKHYKKYDKERQNEKYKTVEVMYFIQSKDTRTMETMTIDIFDDIKHNDNKTFDFQSIITWLENQNIKNVIIMDFSCSSFSNPDALNNNDIINHLNKLNLHGGMKKTTQINKKTKK